VPWIRAPTLGATDQGAEPGATSAATSCHEGSAASYLGAVIRGAEASNLGAAVHGAELRVHFLKSFQEGRICEILSQKGPKNKKVRPVATTHQTRSWPAPLLVQVGVAVAVAARRIPSWCGGACPSPPVRWWG
jgi:hypothetical protein